MIKKIAIGSIRNKLVFILPAVLLLSQFVPWIITPILMLGGLYLSYEGAEKVWEVISGHSKQADAVPAAAAMTSRVIRVLFTRRIATSATREAMSPGGVSSWSVSCGQMRSRPEESRSPALTVA